MKNLSYISKTPNALKTLGVFLCLTLSTSNTSFAQNKKSAPKGAASSPKSQQGQTKPLPRRDIGGSVKVHSLGVGIGQTFLSGDFGDNGEDKITADLYYAFKASHSFDFMANFHTSSHKHRDTKTTISGLGFGIRGRAYQFDAFAPFAMAGLGFYQPQVKRYVDQVLAESEEKIIFGMHVGGGAELQLNQKISVGILGHYHNPFDVKQDIGPEVEGAYFKLLMTCLYNF